MLADWHVDPASCRISQGDKTIRLEPKVMEVLVYLASNPGKVINREELEEKIWTGTIVGYDALTSTMLKLRKAFNDSPKDPQIIETVPKPFYRSRGSGSVSQRTEGRGINEMNVALSTAVTDSN